MKQIQKTAADTCNVMDLTAAAATKQTGRGEDFQKIMKETAHSKEDARTVEKSVKKEGVSEESPQTEVLRKVFGAGQQKALTKEVKVSPETDSDVLAAVQVLLADIRELFVATFQISEEELQGVMDAMGITDADLLNPKVLTDLAVELSPAEDVMGLLTDEDMSDKLRMILEESGQMKAEVLDTWDMAEPKLQMQAENLKNIPQGKETAAEEIMSQKTDNSKIVVQESPDVRKLSGEEKPVVVQEEVQARTDSMQVEEQSEMPNKDTAQDSSSQDSSSQDSSSQNSSSQNPSSQNSSSQNLLSRNQEMKDTENHTGVQMNPAANTVLQNISEAIAEVETGVEPEQIVRQLVEEIKVSVKAETTSFEMQLNPEHLGKVNLQVVAKNGVVTAQLAAENQAVKEVLEAQVQILKDNLQNQGVKVAAVEVTIASHGFEQNLDQQKQSQEQEKEQKTKRPFRYDVMDADETELTSEELIAKEMMMAHGNRINYTA